MSHKKQIFKLSILKKFLNDANSCVSLVPHTRLLALPPFFLNDMKSGIFYLLNSILKKYDRSLDGIIIGYQNVKILMDENTGIIPIGSAETEVNVSVEFYIFQPKIGNTLEGVINKKSNNHIGCLVHQYFNATILKPEDVAYEDWNCRNFEVNEKILFTVKDLDFTGLLPYIEGTVNNEDLLQCSNSKNKAVCDLDVHKDSQNKISRNISNESLETLMCKSQILRESTVQDNNVNSLVDNVLNEDSSKKKKKKKKSKEKQEKDEKDQSLGPSFLESVVNDSVKETTNDNAQEDKIKKNRKKRKKDLGEESINSELFKKEEDKNTLTEFLLQKFLHGDSDNDFVKPIKSKKEKKKKKKEKESLQTLNKITEGLPKNEDFFYSTQLEPDLETKMNSSCSPIPKRISNVFNEKPEPSPLQEKKKDRKRKAGDSSDVSSAKKIKKDDTEVNGTTSLVDELLRQELNRVKDALNMSEKKKEEKPSAESNSLYEKLMKQAKSEIAPRVNKESESDSSSKKKKKHKERKNGSMCGVKITSEKSKRDKSLLSDSEQSLQSSATKKNVNGVPSNKKTLVQTMLDQFFQPQGKKSDSGKESAKRETENKETKPKSPDKEKAESLYEKLLREARSMIETKEDSPPKKKRKMK